MEAKHRDLATFQAIASAALAAALRGPAEAAPMARMLWDKLQSSGLSGEVSDYCSTIVVTLHALSLEMVGVADLERQIEQRAKLNDATPTTMQ